MPWDSNLEYTAMLVREDPRELTPLGQGHSHQTGTDTCGGFAGSLGYEEIDAATFSKWGIDCEATLRLHQIILLTAMQTSNTTIATSLRTGPTNMCTGRKTKATPVLLQDTTGPPRAPQPATA
jgi:hypothetical protein